MKLITVLAGVFAGVALAGPVYADPVVDHTTARLFTRAGAVGTFPEGERAFLEYQITNNGPNDAVDFYDEIYFSTDATFDATTDTFLYKSWKHTVPIATGARTTLKKFDLRALGCQAAGTYWIFIVANSDNGQLESAAAKANNVYSMQFTISAAVGQPDLIIAADSRSAEVVHDDVTKASYMRVTYRIKNNGTAFSCPDFRDRISYSPAASVGDVTTYERNSFNHNVPIPPKWRTSVHTRNVTLADSTTTGYAYVCADEGNGSPMTGSPGEVAESDESNNCVFIQHQSSLADLIVADNAKLVGSVRVGENTTVEYQVTNIGQQAAGAFYDSIVIEDGDKYVQFAHSDTAYSSDIHQNGLAVGESTALSQHVVDLMCTPAGTYNLRIIADSGYDATEADESNNDKGLSLTIDAQTNFADIHVVDCPEVNDVFTYVTDATTGVHTLTVEVTYLLKNLNNYRACPSAPWRDAIYFSEDDQLDKSTDVRIGESWLHDQVAARQSTSEKAYTVTLPAGVMKGYIIVEADVDNFVQETDETNNWHPQPFAFTI